MFIALPVRGQDLVRNDNVLSEAWAFCGVPDFDVLPTTDDAIYSTELKHETPATIREKCVALLAKGSPA